MMSDSLHHGSTTKHGTMNRVYEADTMHVQEYRGLTQLFSFHSFHYKIELQKSDMSETRERQRMNHFSTATQEPMVAGESVYLDRCINCFK
ncbi:hypothetical protein MPTK1_8g05970 [Marchantia polymorpha subsp. ruderalis]|uniref:Uncharacterized protein n=1 Tax=Marchantia polymorpha TaxID=3197 RepID=A0A2R6XIT4_MARPO|nr:hypothetical protein MARPO_0013s0193 [Marchantia polymorpha]BBN18843.1 hypothetical protein Mp_8g05970 [Marchantia polymorpha subsp. ruderalis]|eukprot:PTQ46001.1 hypothetical protein MARPO_0013s0193 [Marchantia polymorpha]